MTFIQFFNNIKNVPRCIDCKYYFISKVNGKTNMYNTAECIKNVVKCTDTGFLKFEYAYIARNDNKICGHAGSQFKAIRK